MAVTNLVELAEASADRLGERRYLEIDGQQYSNLQILERGRRLQAAFAEAGLEPGGKAIVQMMNHALQYPVMQGIFRAGATAVPVMPQLAAAELRYVVSDTRAQVIVVEADRLPVVREAIKGTSHVRRIVVEGGMDDPEAEPREIPLDALLNYEPPAAVPKVDPDFPAVMLYSSGTTGRPKGVLLTHANLLASAAAVVEASQLDTWEGSRITLSAMPIAHIFGVAIMNDLLMTPDHLADQTRLVQMRWFEPEAFMAMIHRHRCTATAVVPTILAVILHHPKAKEFDLSSMREIVVGGAPLPVELAHAFTTRYPCRIREVYGLTEAAGMGTANRRGEPDRPGSAGRAYINMEMRIVDDSDRPMPTGQRGEICIRGPVVMKGYHNRPDETAETTRGGWLHTGDIGYLDEDGFLFVVDRKKDMIIRGGENIYPAELEAVLHEHPAVAEAAVVGVPDEVYGENVVAFVVPAPGSALSESDVIEHVCKHIAKFKAPTKVHFAESLPKSNIGKILRRLLRDKAVSAE